MGRFCRYIPTGRPCWCQQGCQCCCGSPVHKLGISVRALSSFVSITVLLTVCPFRMGFTRLAETSILKIKGKSETDSLGPVDKILSSTVGGALATWNQPIEVIRVEVSIFRAFLESHATQLVFRCNPWQRAPQMPTDLRNLPFSTRWRSSTARMVSKGSIVESPLALVLVYGKLSAWFR